ncbi:MAG: M48 family metallopeptidase, partial [Bacteroidales bacterium]
MKTAITILAGLLLLLTQPGRAQSLDTDIKAIVNKPLDELKTGDEIRITSIYHMFPPGTKNKKEKNKRYFVRYKANRKEGLIPLKEFLKSASFLESSSELLWDHQTMNHNLTHIDKYGLQEAERKNIQESSRNFSDLIIQSNEDFEDINIKNYVSSVLHSVAPIRLLDNRKPNISISVVRDLTPGAFILPNGNTVITTGLLSELKTEDELAAVLTHELVHYVLEHSLKNYTAQIVRERRAQMWSAILATAALATEAVIDAKSDSYYQYCPYDPNYYEFGALAAATYDLSSIISLSILDHMNMRYTKKQEFEADRIAKDIISSLGYNPNSMSTALLRLKRYCVENNDQSDLMISYTHPSIDERIQKIGQPEEHRDKDYELKTSHAITDCAKIAFCKKEYRKAIILTDKNIYNGTSNIDDYILKGASMLEIEHTPSKIEHSITLFEQALQL